MPLTLGAVVCSQQGSVAAASHHSFDSGIETPAADGALAVEGADSGWSMDELESALPQGGLDLKAALRKCAHRSLALPDGLCQLLTAGRSCSCCRKVVKAAIAGGVGIVLLVAVVTSMSGDGHAAGADTAPPPAQAAPADNPQTHQGAFGDGRGPAWEDECRDLRCVPSDPACKTSSCHRGECVEENKEDGIIRDGAVVGGTACDDGDSGTELDVCSAGVCAGTVVECVQPSDVTRVYTDGVDVGGEIVCRNGAAMFSFRAQEGTTYHIQTELDSGRGGLPASDMQLLRTNQYHAPNDGTCGHDAGCIAEQQGDSELNEFDSFIEWTRTGDDGHDGMFYVQVTGEKGHIGRFTLSISKVDAAAEGENPCAGGDHLSEVAASISYQPEDGYGNDLDCTWIVTCPDSTDVVALRFSAFSTEATFDMVTLIDGVSDSHRIIEGGELSGSKGSSGATDAEFTSSGNVMTVQFVSDHDVTSDGFEATYICTRAPPPPPPPRQDAMPPPPPPPPCNADPCVHGRCTNAGNTYSCACDAGYEGANCNTHVDPCSGRPCGDHGECYQQGLQPTCACAMGWSGAHCEVQDPSPPPPLPITIGQPIAGVVSEPNQQVFFLLAAQAGHTYTLDTTTGSLTDTMMSLYGIDQSIIAENDDDERETGSLDSFIEWTCPADGPYPIMVRGFDTQTGTFTLTVTESVAEQGGDPCAGEGVLLDAPAEVIIYHPVRVHLRTKSGVL